MVDHSAASERKKRLVSNKLGLALQEDLSFVVLMRGKREWPPRMAGVCACIGDLQASCGYPFVWTSVVLPTEAYNGSVI
jgi:hypothetical protein